MGNKLYYTLLTVLALLFCTIAYCFASNTYYSGTCVRVLDGDTIDVADESQNLHRIRIIGIDAQELSQPYGKIAKDALADMILRKEVKILPSGIDKYNRELASIRLDTRIGQLDVAETMVSEGHAFDWGGQYYKAQSYAQENHLGVWQDTKYQERPWFYRRRMALEHGKAY